MNKPDLTGIKIIHCAMRGDLHRLVTLTENITAGRETFNARRATALAVFVDELCHAIHVHHTREDDIVWPAIERAADTAVDLSDLSDDHSQLDPLLTEVSVLMALVCAASGPTCSPRRCASCATLTPPKKPCRTPTFRR